jgi:hypothetical protein
MSNKAEKAALERRLLQLTELLVYERQNNPLPSLLQRRIERCVDALHNTLEPQAASPTSDANTEEVLDTDAETAADAEVAADAEAGRTDAPQRASTDPAASASLPELKRTAPLLPRIKRSSGKKSRRQVRR